MALRSAAARGGVAVSLAVAHPPILRLADNRLPGMGTAAVRDVAAVVVVAHQCADVPADLACCGSKASHCFCTSFSA